MVMVKGAGFSNLEVTGLNPRLSVLGQDSLLFTMPLSTQEYITFCMSGYWQTKGKCRGISHERLASHPRGVAILLVASSHRNWHKV